jgi:hypothetical protein
LSVPVFDLTDFAILKNAANFADRFVKVLDVDSLVLEMNQEPVA